MDHINMQSLAKSLLGVKGLLDSNATKIFLNKI